MEKTMENVQNRSKKIFIEIDEYKKIITQQSILTFNGTHKSYKNCDSYSYKENEFLKSE